MLPVSAATPECVSPTCWFRPGAGSRTNGGRSGRERADVEKRVSRPGTREYVAAVDGQPGLTALLSALRAVDIVYWLVAGGVLGVVFVSYITIYLPQKQSQNPSK